LAGSSWGEKVITPNTFYANSLRGLLNLSFYLQD
jgi:hypothetical protein